MTLFRCCFQYEKGYAEETQNGWVFFFKLMKMTFIIENFRTISFLSPSLHTLRDPQCFMIMSDGLSSKHYQTF